VSDLATWLLDRIAEDEAVARDVWQRPHFGRCNTQGDLSSLGDECDCGLPARVLAECAAKRRLIALGEKDSYWDDVLRLLALPYADCDGYDPSWGVQ
jgi:hypothetical protein